MKEIKIIEQSVKTAHETITNFKIKSKKDLEIGKQYLNDIKFEETKVKEFEARFIKPLRDHIKTLNDPVLIFKKKIKECETHIKSELLSYSQKQAEKIENKKQQIEQKVDTGELDFSKGAEKIAKQDEKLDLGIKTRKVVSLKITDANLIPREYLIPDERAIKEALQSGKSIPGCELEENKIIVK